MLFAYVKKCAAGEMPLSVVYTVSGKKTKEGQQVCAVSINIAAGLIITLFRNMWLPW